MIDLTKAKLPEAVKVEGGFFRVRTSFKYWLNFLALIEGGKRRPADFDFMYVKEKPKNRAAGLLAMIEFCNPPSVLPRTDKGGESGGKAVDYAIDADYIFAAFMERYGIDLVESDLHWHKFLALFKGLRDTKLNEIIGYRLWENASGKRGDYERQMEKLKAAWELPQESDEEDEDLKAFEALLYPAK